MDLVEINEAFATQYLAVEKDLGLDREKTNVNGGAIALGHPLGASGARLALTLAYELRKREKRYGLASLCIGGGQGIAAVIERIARSMCRDFTATDELALETTQDIDPEHPGTRLMPRLMKAIVTIYEPR